MGDDSPEREELRVVDKRRFTSEGDSRAASGESDSAAEATPKKVAAIAEEKSTAAVQQKPSEPPRPGASDRTAAQGMAEEDDAVDFTSLVMSLATQALVMLGEVPNPESRTVMTNLPGARQTIEILSMLEKKTKGNLSPEEEQLLTEVLASLHLTFAAKSKQR